MSVLGKNIKSIRIKRNLSQQEFADMLCVTQQAVGKWEHGTSILQLDRLQDISDSLNIPACAVLYDNDEVIYEIPIDITDEVKARIAELKKLSLTTNLTYAEKIELQRLERNLELKKDKWMIHLTCTEYEYNLYNSIKHIYPMYSIDAFCKIVQGARIHGFQNTANNQ